MILRVAQGFGYRLPDLAWLTLGDLEYLVPAPREESGGFARDSDDSAFTL